MKLCASSVLIVCLLLLLGGPGRVCAQISPEMQNSAVRIICPAPADDDRKGFKVMHVKLSSGEVVNIVNYSFGTGFVINNDGIIVTNNHVIATDPLKDTPCPIVMVMQKTGQQFILHKATVRWQSPNGDLGIIQAPSVKAPPLPLVFDETKSTPSEEVFSMGFPGITDLAEEDFKRSDEVRHILVRNNVNKRIQEAERQERRNLQQSEIDAIARDVSSKTPPLAVDWMELLSDLSAFLQSADEAAPAWDVTEVVAHRKLWADYFKPTVTKGSIERIARVHGFLGVTFPDVLTFQHSCPIKHGNSGGPLLNGGGQVIGVVGRGERQEKSGDREEIKWAAAAGELKDWLESHQVAYTAAAEWHKAADQAVRIVEQLPATIIEKPTLKVVEHLPAKIIAAISLAVVVAIAVAIFGLMKTREAPSVTKLLSDPRMAKVLGTAPADSPAKGGPRLRRPSNASSSGSEKWQLAGRTSKGGRVRIELTDTMFASNDNRLILGRSAELCHVVVDDDSVSKQHAHLRKDGDRFLIADRNSSNHTVLNGQIRVNVFDELLIKEGDTVALGEVRLNFSKL